MSEQPIRNISTHERFAQSGDTIVALKGQEHRLWSLPVSNVGDSPVGEHQDDWIMTGEKSTPEGARVLSLARYQEDGSIETRTDIPSNVFEDYQVDVDAERRVREARAYQDLGESAVKMSLMSMVRSIRNNESNEKYAAVVAAEKRIPAEIRALQDKRISQSLHNIEDYRSAKRRENPLGAMSQGKHHKARA